MVMAWQRRLEEVGGIATASDLRAMGLSDVDIRMFAQYGLLRRVRQGWYSAPDTARALVEACRLGGRLACVSALRHHGRAAPDDGRIHVEVPANAVLRREARAREDVRIHWTRHPSPGGRGAVVAESAAAQAIACVAWPPL